MQATKHIRVERPFLIGGVRQERGAVLELSSVLAIELVHAHKAVFVEAAARQAQTPTVEGPTQPRRESGHAR